MTVNQDKFPPCFGILKNVFPCGENGLREVPESCFFCYCKVNCMKIAIGSTDGLEVKKKIIDSAYSSGSLTFIQRWSKLKVLQKNKKK